jgi:AraC-like DNA-binding protein
MPDRNIPLKDITTHGKDTVLRGVKAAHVDYRPWLASFPVCPALNPFQMAHLGLLEALSPYEIVRTRQTSTYFLACYGGKGKVLIDGRWRNCGAGMACLLPAHTLNAFYALPRVKWEFVWVCYVQPDEQRPVFNFAAPVMARYNPELLRLAILGLLGECTDHAAPQTIQHWVELIHGYVMRFAMPFGKDLRLISLWERVTAQLQADWTLEKLAQESGYSKEHLRRLCRREIGRSPMHQVIHLRMRRAADLLAGTNNTIETVAQAVGYESPFVFSNSFHKWVGWRPSEYRRGGG